MSILPLSERRWNFMADEYSLRRPSFAEGTRITLADGQAWSLPDHPPYNDDPEHLALLRGVSEAEDDAERLRAELALAIFLLSRNYDLLPRDYRAILQFEPGDPALAEMQRAVHTLAADQVRALRLLDQSASSPSPVPKA